MNWLKNTLIILLSGLVMAAIGFYGELWFVSTPVDRSNPQDPTGWPALFAFPAAAIGFVIGATIAVLDVFYRHCKRRIAV